MKVRVLLFIAVFLIIAPVLLRAQPPLNILNQSGAIGEQLITGAEQFPKFLPLLKGIRVALVANQTSITGQRHLADTLLGAGVNLLKIFAPEHGFRGEAEAGATIKDGKDVVTGLPVISLYGRHKMPMREDLEDVDLVIFDIQDVGARFYTYISTLSYVMEACAKYNKELLVFDRPNPNGYYVDGPVLQKEYSSFVGLHPIPIVHGMTMAEYALMVNGEGWLPDGLKCRLNYIPMIGYAHSGRYMLPVAPSPNLPAMDAIYLYPSLCLFEGTSVSVGRGTSSPFTIIGHPAYPDQKFSFTPHPIKGIAENPPYERTKCYGLDLEQFAANIYKQGRIELSWLIHMYDVLPDKASFFNNFFEKLAGSPTLRKQIEAGVDADEIRESWQADLKEFKTIRRKYLLYPDFE
ncbi:DUF1343 domain-containing protein [Lentimicrobium sp.]